MSSKSAEDNSDLENKFKNRLESLRKSVEKLQKRKLQLEEQLQLPVKFGDMQQVEYVGASTDEIERTLKQVEKDHVTKRLFFHKLTGVRPAVQEKKDLVFEFNACVKGHYSEPYYLRLRKVHSGNYQVVNYFLPVSIHVKEIIGDKLVSDAEVIELMDTIQRCVRAFHSRKMQISEVKGLLQDVKLFISIDYRFVELKFVIDGVVLQRVSVNLIYKCERDIPSTLKVYCKEADKETLASVTEDCNKFLKLPLPEAFKILFLKKANSDSSMQSDSTIPAESTMKNSLEESNDAEWLSFHKTIKRKGSGSSAANAKAKGGKSNRSDSNAGKSKTTGSKAGKSKTSGSKAGKSKTSGSKAGK